jgi:hypothetical protein
MNYVLENIPDELWRRIRQVAAMRGQSEKTFLLNAAFNEIERTSSILPSPVEAPMVNDSDLRQGAGGTRSYPRPDMGDRVALALRGKTLDEQYEYVAGEIGVDESELRARFKNFSDFATQRTSLGNVLRGFYRGEDSENRHLRNLRTVGIKTFIEDYDILRDYESRDAVAYFRNKRGFKYNSANTKTSTGKRILSDSEALRFCLDYIGHRSINVDESLKEKARRLMAEL